MALIYGFPFYKKNDLIPSIHIVCSYLFIFTLALIVCNPLHVGGTPAFLRIKCLKIKLSKTGFDVLLKGYTVKPIHFTSSGIDPSI